MIQTLVQFFTLKAMLYMNTCCVVIQTEKNIYLNFTDIFPNSKFGMQWVNWGVQMT